MVPDEEMIGARAGQTAWDGDLRVSSHDFKTGPYLCHIMSKSTSYCPDIVLNSIIWGICVA